MPDGDERNIYAYSSEEDFDRVGRAMRFAEKAMRGSLEDGPFERLPKQGMDVFVLVQSDKDSYGFYGGQFILFDNELGEWVTFGITCRVADLNGRSLRYSPPTRYSGYVVAVQTTSGEPVVAVTVGEDDCAIVRLADGPRSVDGDYDGYVQIYNPVTNAWTDGERVWVRNAN